MSTTGWVDPDSFEGALRDLSKRLARLERRPASMSTSDLLGPGLASYAVGIIDWNATEATLNGFYYTFPGSLNSPDEALSWTGQTIAKDDGTGMQQVWNTDGPVPIYWVRTYAPNVVPGGPPVYDDWKRFATGSGLIEGDMLDPDTFPGEMEPTDPPLDSPTPVTTKGPSAVIVHYEWTRGESVDLYVSLVDGAPIDGTTLHTVNFPEGGFVYTDAAGNPLPVDTDVFFALVAKNAAGEAVESAWVPGQAGGILPEYLHMLVGTLIAQRLETETLFGVLITGSELNITGAIHAYDNFLSIVAQTMTAYSAVFEDNLDLRGDNNVLRGTFTITSGVPDPKAPPEVAPYWPSVTTDMATDEVVETDKWYGLCPNHGVGGANQVGSCFVFGNIGGFRFHDLTTGDRNPFIFPNWTDFLPEGGCASDGTYYYILGRDISIGTNAWRVRKYNSDFTVLEATFNPGIGTPAARPCIGGRNVGGSTAGFVVVEPGTGLFGQNFHFEEFNATGVSIAAGDLIYDPGDIDLGGCARYESAPGTHRIAIAPEAGHDILGFDPAGGAPIGSATRPRASNNRVRGLYRDASRFRSMNRSGTIYTYSTYAGGDPGAVYAYVDGDGAGLGTAISGPSPVGTATIPRSAYIEVTTQAPPDQGGTDDPDRNYIYLGASVAATKFLSVTDGILAPGDLVAVFDVVPTSGDNPKVTSEFAGRATTTNGRIASAALDDDDDPMIDFLGTGEWRLDGPNMVDSGDLTPTGLWAGRVRFTRIGHQVFYEGHMDRDDNYGTTDVTIDGITIPTWARPPANKTAKPLPGYGTANQYRYSFNADGTMSVQRTGVITTFMTFDGHYFVA